MLKTGTSEGCFLEQQTLPTIMVTRNGARLASQRIISKNATNISENFNVLNHA